MDDIKEPEEIEAVSSLANDPSAFFSSMENRLGAGRLQHTPSMMEIPSSFIDDVFDEALYSKYDNKDDDDEDEYEYPSEEDDEEQSIGKRLNGHIDYPQSPQATEDSQSKEVAPPIPTAHSSSLLSEH